MTVQFRADLELVIDVVRTVLMTKAYACLSTGSDEIGRICRNSLISGTALGPRADQL